MDANGRELKGAGMPDAERDRRERFTAMIPEPEWVEWYGFTMQRRWEESEKLWQRYLEIGGSLDPEPDTQSPFFDEEEWRELSAHGRPGVRLIRRSGV